MIFRKFLKEVRETLNLKVERKESFKNHTTFRIGGKIKYFVEVKEEKTLIKLLEIAKKHNVKYFILGQGSNLLCKDKTYKNLVIKISLNDIKVNNNKVTCGAGVTLYKLNLFLFEKGLSGMEWSFGIPGSVGGGVKMNAGAFNKEMKDVISAVYFTDGEKVFKRKKEDLLFSYRKSFFENKNLVILRVEFALFKDEKEKIKERAFLYLEKRRKLQPYNYASAGSVFKNTKDYSAGYLIESVGLKGYRVGNAQISQKHANFIVNLDNKAKFREVFKIILKIKRTVFKMFDIILFEEIEIV